ncbi:MAG: CPBP family intramembrane metalloprotease, partial [Pyrinomonadaceae bacterium]|nr:CPBP family intramembrane metalloprotease [Phycisphaerales bacterium]
LRGVSFQRWRDDMGFVAPKGVMREIAAGVVGYLAGLPIFIVGVGISLILKLVLESIKTQAGGEAGAPASNPIFDEIVGSDPLNLILLVSLATIWAPFVEEAIFRGAMFRHLRSRTGLLIAAVVSAIAFGGMHGYELVLLGPVISLGFVFALMREWRKSIIPSITAHMLHNGTVVTLAIIMIRLISA